MAQDTIDTMYSSQSTELQQPEGRGKRRGLKRLLLVGALAVVVLVGLEVFCRCYLGLGDPPLSRADPEIGYMFVGPRVYHRFGNRIEYNRFSMRTRNDFDGVRKDPKEIRVMMCGDSVINGGVLVDQKDIASNILEQRLGSEFNRATLVMNVSAGSWSPPNAWAYVKRYGWFESNVLVLVWSSHDGCSSLTFEPLVGVSPDFPDKTPMFAFGEAVTRYLPRYLPGKKQSAGPYTYRVSRGLIDQSRRAFREMITTAKENGIAVVMAVHLEQKEYGKAETVLCGFRKICEELQVPVVELGDWLDPAKNPGA
ncbi:MAG: hypothetical protein FWD53_08715, partial [Phycisphaerales bacterium]|nr:hypothetical protein [Phycisphaerales bacterium]